MQLTRHRSRLAAVTLAVFAMLGTARGQHLGQPGSSAAADEAAATPEPSAAVPELSVRASSDVGAYADSDHVYVLTPSVSATVAKPIAGWSVGGQYLLDVVSAASVDIVSTASRHWQEVRQAGTFDGSYKPGTFGVAAAGVYSTEPDYQSWTAGGSVTQDLLDQNATLLFGFSHGHDVAGRSGTHFSVFARRLDRESMKAGLTLVLDPSTIASFMVDGVVEHGDPSKPYRYIPLFAPGTAVPLGASIEQVTALRVSARPLEQLPLSRDRFALSLRIAHRFSASTLRVDERLYADSWALAATSTDARYLLDLGRRVELGPHLRVHAQTAASFWQRAYILRPGFDYPALRTGDRELGPLVGMTVGWTFRFGLGPASNPNEWRLGWDMNLSETRYLDDLYITGRLSALGVLSLEAQL
jgi:hypothetical protein